MRTLSGCLPGWWSTLNALRRSWVPHPSVLRVRGLTLLFSCSPSVRECRSPRLLRGHLNVRITTANIILNSVSESRLSLNSVGERRQIRSNLHALIRCGCAVGISLLCLRKFLYFKYPGFLPSAGWHPVSASAKWTAIVFNSAVAAILLLVLLGMPLCFYIAIRHRRDPTGSLPVVLDVVSLLVLYAAAYFLLFPSS